MSRFWTLLARSCVSGDHIKIPSKAIISIVALCCLASCGPSSGTASKTGTPSVVSSDETLKPLAAPPGADGRIPAPGTTGAPKTKDGLPALQPPMGLNNTALFQTEISDADERMRRLENAVQELRNDFDNMAPSIVRLVSVEKDIQDLIEQLQSVVNENPAPITEEELNAPISSSAPTPEPMPPADPASFDDAAPSEAEILPAVAPPPANVATTPPAASPSSAPAPAPEDTPDAAETLLNAPIAESPPTGQQTAPDALKPLDQADGAPVPIAPAVIEAKIPTPTAKTTAIPAAKPVSSAGLAVTSLRVGEHPGKTRLVLDITGGTGGKIVHSVDLDNGEKILVIEIPSASWSAPATRSFAGAPLIASYKADQNASGGTLLIFQLKAPAKILYQGQMAGASGSTGGRLIIDLAKE